MKEDEDIKSMSPAQLRKEVMRLRNAFRKEVANTGNHRCWITLLLALPEGKMIEPLLLPQEEFLRNCKKYYNRNKK